MISSDVIRGYTDTIILSLLRSEPGYGYEISRQISEITEQKYVMRRPRSTLHLPALNKTDTCARSMAPKPMVSAAPITKSPLQEEPTLRKS